MGTNTPRELTSLLDEYRAVRRRMAEMGAEVAAVTATARSVDGSVTATVGPRGELRDLRIDPELASRFDLRTLSARILEAAALAGDEARERIGHVAAALLPAHLRHLVSADGIVDVRGLLPEVPAPPGRSSGGSPPAFGRGTGPAGSRP